MKSLTKSIAIVLVALLVEVPAFQTAHATTSVAVPAETPAALSNAVVSAAGANLKVYSIKKQNGTLEAADVQGVIVALSTLKANMKETGMSDQVTKQILAHENDFLNSGISEQQIEAQYAYIAKGGVKITVGEYRNSLLTTQAQRVQLLARIKAVGIDGVQQDLLTHLGTIKQSLSTGAHAPTALQSSYLLSFERPVNAPSRGHIVKVGNFCDVEAAIFAVGAFFCPPLALVAAVWALESALGMCDGMPVTMSI